MTAGFTRRCLKLCKHCLESSYTIGNIVWYLSICLSWVLHIADTSSSRIIANLEISVNLDYVQSGLESSNGF